MGILWDLYMKSKDSIHKIHLHLESETNKDIITSHTNPSCEKQDDTIVKER